MKQGLKKYDKLPIKSLIPNLKFTAKHGLDEDSHPADWLQAFIPEHMKKGDSRSVCISKWSQYSNMKAKLDFAGNEKLGGLSYNFNEFTPREIEQHLSLYIAQGLSPSPQIKMKAKSQQAEPLQGNDLINTCMGFNFERRHVQFKRYFAVQHPYLPVPSTCTHPNWKIDPFLEHINKVSIQAMHLPENISCDEQTIGFSGRDSKKARVKYKKVGDGYQADSICCQGYTYTFYFRHQPPPKKYIDEGYSPLHARVRFMVDQLKSKHHCLFMDNLYMSAMFARRLVSCEKKVNIHGVTRQNAKGIPMCVHQYEVSDEKNLDEQRNTIKVAVLEGDPLIKDLVAISYYDTKPVYFLSSVIDDVKWIVKSREIYSKNLEKKVQKYFLRPNFVNAYNYDMNSVDQADQLRTNYQVGMGLRQRKWWWSIFLWAFDVAIVNSYLLYKSYLEMHGFQPKSHYTYREEIFKAWMDPDLFWPTRYLRKSRRDMKLISKSSEESDKKRSRLNSGSISSLSRMTRSSYTPLSFPDGPKQSCKTLNQTNLDNGSFGHRLTFSVNCTHLPAPPRSKHSECQLHRLANKRTRKQVMTCNDCNVTLCVNCYKPFHTAHDINMIKADIENDQESSIRSNIPSPSSFHLKIHHKSV